MRRKETKFNNNEGLHFQLYPINSVYGLRLKNKDHQNIHILQIDKFSQNI